MMSNKMILGTARYVNGNLQIRCINAESVPKVVEYFQGKGKSTTVKELVVTVNCD